MTETHPTTDQITPGPWWLEKRSSGGLNVQAKHRGEGSSYCVASVNFHEPPHDEANARLIAAAPELLHALELLYKEMVLSGNATSKDYGWTPAIAASQEAIRKATGKQL